MPSPVRRWREIDVISFCAAFHVASVLNGVQIVFQLYIEGITSHLSRNCPDEDPRKALQWMLFTILVRTNACSLLGGSLE